jgi:hypothetical protein
MRRAARATLRLVTGGLIVLVALAVLLVWRVAEEPVGVGFLLPVLKSHLAVLPPELSFEIEDLVIAWDEDDRSIDLRATGVAIQARNGPVLARFPAVDVGIGLRPLAHGTLALTAIEIKQPSVVLTRRRDGTLTIAGTEIELEQDRADVDVAAALRAIAEDLFAPQDPSRPLSYLREVRVSGGHVAVQDGVLDADWRLPVVDLSLIRRAAGWSGQATLDVAVGDAVAHLDAVLSYAEPRTIKVASSFADVRPRSLAELLAAIDPGFAELAAVDVPLRGTVMARIDPFAPDLRPALAFRIEGDAGTLTHERFPAPLQVRTLRASGRLERARLEVRDAAVAFGTDGAPGPILAFSGVAEDLEDARTFAGTVTLTNLPMAESVNYWPKGLAKGARKWVTRNITAGSLDRLVGAFSVRVQDGDVKVEQSLGTLSYHGLEVQYLREVPSVVGLAGQGTFDRKALHLEALEGASQQLGVKDVVIDITGLDQRDEIVVIDLGIAGAVRDAMDLLDHPRFNLITKLGIAPADTGGSFGGRMTVSVPLKPGVSFDDVGVHFAGRIEDASIRDIRPGFSAGNGQLDLDVDTSRAHFVGPIEINGVPIQVDWMEAFTAESPFATKARITAADVDDAAREALGVDLSPFVHGPLSVAIEATFARGGAGTLDARADLTATELALPFLHWRKEAGIEGEAEAEIALEDDRPARLARGWLGAGSLTAEGTGAFEASGDASETAGGWLDLDRLAFGSSVLEAVSVQWTADHVDVDIGGGTLDVAPFVAAHGAPDAARETGSISLSARNLRRVTFAEGRFLENVSIRLQRSAVGWEHIEFNALVPSRLASTQAGIAAGPQSFTFRYGPLAEGAYYPLLARISDTGGLLRAFDAVDGIKGGYCEIIGRSDGPTPGRPMRATLSCQRITDTEASPMGKILNAMSISGIRQALAGEGITFDRVRGDIVWHNGTATIASAEANNSALGVTIDGRLAIEPHFIDARGTVIPAYTINRLIGRIPLIGGLFNEGQGFLAGHFRVSGRLSDPEITAQPIKSITPSILVRFKNLFAGDDDGARGFRPNGAARPDAALAPRPAPGPP